MSAETECVAKCIADIAFLRLVEREIQTVVNLWVLVLGIMVDGWRNNTIVQCQYRCHSLNRSCRTEEVPCHRLGRVEVHLVCVVAKHLLYSVQFGYSPIKVEVPCVLI